MAKIPFDELPSELIYEISKYLSKCDDLNSLIRSCKRLATCLTPLLYHKSFCPDEIYGCYNHTSNRALWSYTVAAQKLHGPAKHWGSEYILAYFANTIPLQWITRVQFIAQPTSRSGMNLLEIITRAGNRRLLKILLDRGVDIETRGQRDNTPLHFAAEAGLLGTVQLLLDAGADVIARNHGGLTALSLAISEDHADVASLLLDADADGTTVNLAHDPSSFNAGMTPLHYAARSKHCVGIVEALLAKGADMFAQSGGYSASASAVSSVDAQRNFPSLTPLDMAIRGRKDVMAFLLVERMLEMPKELRQLGPTWGDGMPLFIAIRARFSNMVRRLLAVGIDAGNAIDVAIREGAEEIFEFLSAGGIPVKTAIHIKSQ